MDAAEHLPYVDEHASEIAASRQATWEALLRVVEGTVSSGSAPHLARLLGCDDAKASGPRPLAVGSVLPGFHVASCETESELGLGGRHRFSEYALTFRLEDGAAGGTRVRAETRAVFPHLKGSIYRALVIGTQFHVLATRRILTATRRRAERASSRAVS